jgi:hypothetical protein
MTDAKKLGKPNTLPVLDEPLLVKEEPKHQTLVISQSKLENEVRKRLCLAPFCARLMMVVLPRQARD